jgi:hypothetical protein
MRSTSKFRERTGAERLHFVNQLAVSEEVPGLDDAKRLVVWVVLRSPAKVSLHP